MNTNLRFASVGLLALGLGVLLGGCATMSPSAQRLQSDPQFQKAAQDLATAYLEGQKRGDSGAAYGPGASQFYNLSEYKIVGCGHYWGQPAVYIRVKAGNKIGGNPIWTNYLIQMRHYPQSESGDPYQGLRISWVTESFGSY